MPTYQRYSPDQAELLPAHVKDVLGADHLCFVVHEVVEACDLGEFDSPEADEGGQRAYDPRMMLKIWLYGFCVNVRTTRKLEQRIREDLGFRYLAGGATPDHKTLSEFHRRHRQAITAMFTEVLLFLRGAGMARLGTVAIDSTRVKGSASPDRWLQQEQLEKELRKKVEHWQRELNDDPDREPGMCVGAEQIGKLREELRRVQESGEKKLSRTDPDARFLRERGRFVLGYTAEIAVSEDHFIVAQRVTQNKNDNQALLPMVEEIERHSRERPARVLADCGFFSSQNLREMHERGIEAYIPDSNLGVESGRAGARNRADEVERPAPETSATKTAHGARTGLVQETQGAGRAGVRNVKATAGHAAVRAQRKSGGGRGMDVGVHRLQSDALPHAA